ncbi:MAG: hypothetical protein WBG62_09525 [Cyclobacteriaceae bacterium]
MVLKVRVTDRGRLFLSGKRNFTRSFFRDLYYLPYHLLAPAYSLFDGKQEIEPF